MSTDKVLKVSSLDSLLELVRCDLDGEGVGSATRDRYPARFVLFDTFDDSKAFVQRMINEFHFPVYNADNWMDSDPSFADVLLSRSELVGGIRRCAREDEKSFIVTPFSELARFYDNTHYKEFDSTLTTIKDIESLRPGSHQRIYIPVIGLEEKMMTFHKCPNIVIWQLTRGGRAEAEAKPGEQKENDSEQVEKAKNYRLTLTNGSSYGVKNLASRFQVVNSVMEWLQFWKSHNDSADPDEQLLCTSPSIFANSGNARPDNAFSYTICRNVKEFLSDGLHFGTSDIPFDDDSLEYWDRLAADIDISSQSSFAQYAERLLDVKPTMDDDGFLKVWFNSARLDDVAFRRWVLCQYYELHSDRYLATALKSVSAYDDNCLCRTIAFMPFPTEGDNVRTRCLNLLKENGASLGDDDARHLVERICDFAAKHGERAALAHVSRLTWHEQFLVLQWVAKGLVGPDEAGAVFPDLVAYLGRTGISDELDKYAEWVPDYIDAYKRARLLAASSFGQEIDGERKKRITEGVEAVIAERNASAVSFSKWYESFSAVSNVLFGHDEIDSFFWIDGLGIDWIPFVANVIKGRESNGFYLNEVHIAKAQLPSVTSVNKVELQRLSATIVDNKVGDLDHMAHEHKATERPKLMEEIVAVRHAVEKALDKHAGKKIAIVSDHGLTYLSQFYPGLGLHNFDDDHHGRTARSANGPAPRNDEVYKVLPDGVTVCALRHSSLFSKVPKGEGAHGGLTPEECLVPIFIISPSKKASSWQAVLLSHADIGNNPVVQFKVKGLTSGAMPKLAYNGRQYAVSRQGDVYTSEMLDLDQACRKVVVSIDGDEQALDIDFTLGAEEDDLFG